MFSWAKRVAVGEAVDDLAARMNRHLEVHEGEDLVELMDIATWKIFWI